MKIKILFLCEHSSMLTSSIFDVEIDIKYLLNVIISLGHITCFHLVTRMSYI